MLVCDGQLCDRQTLRDLLIVMTGEDGLDHLFQLALGDMSRNAPLLKMLGDILAMLLRDLGVHSAALNGSLDFSGDTLIIVRVPRENLSIKEGETHF